MSGVIKPHLFYAGYATPSSSSSSASLSHPTDDSAVTTQLTTSSLSVYAKKRDRKQPSYRSSDKAVDSEQAPRYTQDEFLRSIETTLSPSGVSSSGASTQIPTNNLNQVIRNTPITAAPSSSDTMKFDGTGSTYLASPLLNNRAISSSRIQPPKSIIRLVGQAICEWAMINDGDRLLLGLSGGKDSLALLHILLAFQKKAPIKFDIACATVSSTRCYLNAYCSLNHSFPMQVDPQTASFDPSPLIPYVQSLGVTYHYLSEPIVELARSKMQGDSLCAFCSRMKRGLLYSCCRTFKYNKLVLAQHLDDLAESFLMSALHNGQVSSSLFLSLSLLLTICPSSSLTRIITIYPLTNNNMTRYAQ